MCRVLLVRRDEGLKGGNYKYKNLTRGYNACCSDSEKYREWYLLDSPNTIREWLSFSESIISCTSSLSNGMWSDNDVFPLRM